MECDIIVMNTIELQLPAYVHVARLDLVCMAIYSMTTGSSFTNTTVPENSKSAKELHSSVHSLKSWEQIYVTENEQLDSTVVLLHCVQS